MGLHSCEGPESGRWSQHGNSHARNPARLGVDQQLEQGCVLHGRRLTVFLKSLLADYDAIRVIFDTKGAGALKPCALCSNVLAKAQAEADNGPFFMTISSCDQSRFVGYNMTESVAMCDEQLLEAQHLTTFGILPRQELFVC